MRKTMAAFIAAGTLTLTACGSGERSTPDFTAKQDRAAETCTSHFSDLDNVTDHMGWSDGPQVQMDGDEADVSGVAYFTTKTAGPGEYDVTCTADLSDGGAAVLRGESARIGHDSEQSSSPTTSRSAAAESSDASPWGELNATLWNQMQERGIPTGNMTNSTAVKTADAACEARDTGVEARTLLDLVVSEMPMWDSADSMLYLELSFSIFCPEHATI